MTDSRLEPHDWQAVDIENLLFWDCTALVAIQTGGGKSLLAVEAVHRAGHAANGAVLVIAPKSTFSDAWVRTVKRQTGEDIRIINSKKAGKEAEADLRANKPGWYLINHELFTRRQWDGVRVEVCICDEVAKMSNWRLWFRKSSGAHRLIYFKAKRRIAMSATPYRNDFANMWTVLRWVYPEITDSSPRKWIAKYCTVINQENMDEPGVTKEEKKQVYFAGEVVKGEKEPGRVVSELPCYIYHAKRQRCCEFHPNGFLATEEPSLEIRTVEMTGEQKKAYHSMEENYIAWLGENPHVVELPIVARSRLRQISLGMIQFEEDGTIGYAPDCESPKFNELVNVLSELGDEQVLVLTHSKKFATVVADRLNGLGTTASAWTGDVSMKDREQIEADFADGTIRVIVGVIAAMGTGVSSLARVTSTCVWMSRSDDPSDNFQAEGRLDRLDSIGRVSNIEIQAEGTYDAGVLSHGLQKRLEMNQSLASKNLA